MNFRETVKEEGQAILEITLEDKKMRSTLLKLVNELRHETIIKIEETENGVDILIKDIDEDIKIYAALLGKIYKIKYAFYLVDENCQKSGNPWPDKH